MHAWGDGMWSIQYSILIEFVCYVYQNAMWNQQIAILFFHLSTYVFVQSWDITH